MCFHVCIYFADANVLKNNYITRDGGMSLHDYSKTDDCIFINFYVVLSLQKGFPTLPHKLPGVSVVSTWLCLWNDVY